MVFEFSMLTKKMTSLEKEIERINFTMQPLVTVGIPTYNRPSGLKNTLEMITNQSYRNLHILVSDNASDDSLNIESMINAYQKVDYRIEYYRQSYNKGPISNFQYLIDNRLGEYFMFASDDDWWDRDYIKELVQGLEICKSASLSFSNYMVVNQMGEQIFSGYPSDYIELLKPFTSENIKKRLRQYIKQPEIKGKQNMFYGCIRSEHLKEVDLEKFVGDHGFHGFDALFIFSILSQGELFLAERILRKTVVSKKETEKHRNDFYGSILRMKMKVSLQKNYIKYLLEYIPVAKEKSVFYKEFYLLIALRIFSHIFVLGVKAAACLIEIIVGKTRQHISRIMCFNL